MKTQEEQMKTNPGLIKKTTLLLGDCLDKLKELEDNSVDSIVSDPPYGLSFMGKKWDYDVPSQAIWEECMRVLKPGGHLLSFAGSRTYHRMAVRIEDAGFEIRDQIMWVYGSGFPKSHNISKQLDKRGGNNHLVSEVSQKLKEARESRGISKTEADKLFCESTTNYMWFEGRKDGVRLPDDVSFEKICNEWSELKPYQDKIKSANREVVGNYDGDMGGLGGERLGNGGGDITISATDVAKEWEGWGTALKPAHEPIVMARKPFKGTVADNVLEYGTGAINIDDCRIETTDNLNGGGYGGNNVGVATYALGDGRKTLPTNKLTKDDYTQPEGRFPANIIFDEEAGKILDEQSGLSKSTDVIRKNNQAQHTGAENGATCYGKYNSVDTGGYNDKGGASRFFYCPKASKKDRDEGLEVQAKPIQGRDAGQDKMAVAYKARPTERQNIHPTVKPTDLMQYLIRLVTKKGGVVLDPFMGSGSTGKAAIKEGMIFVGIEREEEYFEIAKQRIENEIHKNEPKHNFW